MKYITSDKAPAAAGFYSQAVETNGLIFVSGQIALDPASGLMKGTTAAEQTEQAILNISNILMAAGSGIEFAVKTTCYLTDINEFAAFNEIYGKHFTTKPARSCVAVSALPKGALVEIEVVALGHRDD
jgi:2-iminobutanoate/2-iminopropanoate deaminase